MQFLHNTDHIISTNFNIKWMHRGIGGTEVGYVAQGLAHLARLWVYLVCPKLNLLCYQCKNKRILVLKNEECKIQWIGHRHIDDLNWVFSISIVMFRGLTFMKFSILNVRLYEKYLSLYPIFEFGLCSYCCTHDQHHFQGKLCAFWYYFVSS